MPFTGERHIYPHHPRNPGDIQPDDKDIIDLRVEHALMKRAVKGLRSGGYDGYAGQVAMVNKLIHENRQKRRTLGRGTTGR